MSLELKNVEKKIGLDTHIYPTNLKLQKNTINTFRLYFSWKDYFNADYGWPRQTNIRRDLV